MPNTPCKGKSIIHNESVTLLPLQGECIHVVITQGVALGYELFGLSARFNRTVRNISGNVCREYVHLCKKAVSASKITVVNMK